ncbi:MAG: PQQ-binding-like beta-propeller repeat protein [Anaerolineae bacterium]
MTTASDEPTEHIASSPAGQRSGTGFNTDGTESLLKPRTVWSYGLRGQSMAAPISLGDICFLIYQESSADAYGGVLLALDVRDGRLRWERRFDNSVMTGLTRLSDTAALVSLMGKREGDEGSLLAVDMGGGILWQRMVEAQQISAPAVSEDRAMMTVDKRRLFIVDAGTGADIADVRLPVEASSWAPGCGHGKVVVPCQTSTLLAMDASGDSLWRFDLDGMLSSVWLDRTPLVLSSSVIGVLNSGTVLALDLEDGRLMWETRVGPRGKQLTPPVTDGKRIFVGARDGVYALDAVTGAPEWIFRTGSYATASPVVAGDLLFAAGRDRHLYALDRRTGHVQWGYPISQEIKSPALIVDDDAEGPYAVIVDCTGGVFALTYPLPAEDHEAAGRWRKAALAWGRVGNHWKAATSWVKYARWLAEQGGSQEEQAEAWAAAERRYSLVGASQEVLSCRRQYARCLDLPLITLRVQHPGLVHGAWSRLRFVVRNAGYGLARDLMIRADGDQFGGQVARTHHLASLPAGQSVELELDVKPLDVGESVPLRVHTQYRDDKEGHHSRDETLYLPVAQEAAARSPGMMSILSDMKMIAGLVGARADTSAVDLEIRIGRGGETYYDVELTLNREQVFSGGRLPRTALDFHPGADTSVEGRRLFDLLMADPAVREGWHVARGRAESNGVERRVRLRIDEDTAELHVLPWELMSENGTILAADLSTPFSRYLPVKAPWGTHVAARPLRVLAVIANPQDLTDRYGLSPLNVQMEKYILAKAFGQIDPERIRLEFLKPPITLEHLSRAMLQGYHWLHFVGHGRYNPRHQRIDLLMEDSHGGTRAVSERLFCQMLAHQGAQPQLIFLAVCQSALGVNDRTLLGLGPELIRLGVPAVVAMRGRVHLRTAQKVIEVFYRGLVSHGVVDRALNQARSAVLNAELPDLESPVLFMRLLSGQLWRSP